MKRVVLTVSDQNAADSLDRLVARFTEEVAAGSDECVFYMSEPGAGRPARVVETESQATLDRFVALVDPAIARIDG
ncbi:hypothetical protein DDZ18_03545 [Marinicauda salina]|jgi:hypothetical protein|uniref:Uncharacterized protein n=1 Tax=Marinicauda salina TaxID=2135793 RepID=A0A2U2BXF3_9PROT|nr:hypothetical protein [Marinicauda salina]PWE18677.1 hypothetical protein DDZ18_03545 [Marinicauda salina]